jgi:2',3'-cyclic-nucleotide 2'-phosphodiesterase (5'-nucleotidase family)
MQGNHEFDYGPTYLSYFLGNLPIPVVSCNTARYIAAIFLIFSSSLTHLCPSTVLAGLTEYTLH